MRQLLPAYKSKAGLIPQMLQPQEQVNLASLDWCHKSRECVNSCARRSLYSVVRLMKMPAFFCLCSSCSHVTEVGRP